MPISDLLFPCVYSALELMPYSRDGIEQVAPEPGQTPTVDLVVVRENTECLVCTPLTAINETHHAFRK